MIPINTVQAIIFGAIGFLISYLLVLSSNKLIEKKIIKKNLILNTYIKPGSKLHTVIFVVTTALWTSAGLMTDSPYIALIVCCIFSLAIMFSAIDLCIHIIPNELVITIMAVGALFQLIYFGPGSLLTASACMIGVMIILTIAAAILGFNKVGAGDVKLAGAMGLVLGYPYILIAALAMSIVLIIYCIIGFYTYRITLKSMLPYAPFLMTGMTFSLIWMFIGAV